jgi:hypothetical protein
MAIWLNFKKSQCVFNNEGWHDFVTISLEYGWKPEHDHGHYLKEYSSVSDSDAQSLVAALERLLKDSPRPDQLSADERKAFNTVLSGAREGGFLIL